MDAAKKSLMTMSLGKEVKYEGLELSLIGVRK